MSDPISNPGSLVSRLALDAAKPLYPLLHVPPDNGSFAMHQFLKEAIEYSDFAPSWSSVLWPKIISYAEATLDKVMWETWLNWLSNVFTGSHPPNVNLSGWLMAIDYYSLPHADWNSTGMTQDEIVLATHFINSYTRELDETGFMTTIETCRARPLTDWDKRMHQVYEFVYFDRSRGADPFLELKFANQGEAFRRTLRTYDFDSITDFPHKAFLNAAQLLMDRRNIWMPQEGQRLLPLTEVQ